MRAHAGAVRQRAAILGGDGAGIRLARKLLDGVPLRDCETVAGYWPIREEIDPLPAMLALLARGHRLALPVVARRDQPLAFRHWWPGDPLVAGAYDIPAPGMCAPPVTPTLLLVPGLWFDRAGGRLGYGGGFYDRTLAQLRQGWQVAAVGIAHDAQLGGTLDREAHDAPMDWVVTDRRVVRVNNGEGR